jgi:hypothetical protein
MASEIMLWCSELPAYCRLQDGETWKILLINSVSSETGEHRLGCLPRKFVKGLAPLIIAKLVSEFVLESYYW